MSTNEVSLQSIYRACRNKSSLDWKTGVTNLLEGLMRDKSLRNCIYGYRLILQVVVLLNTQDLKDETFQYLVQIVCNPKFPRVEIVLLGESLLWLMKSIVTSREAVDIGFSFLVPLCGIGRKEELVIDNVGGFFSLLFCYCRLLRCMQFCGDKSIKPYVLKFTLSLFKLLIPISQELRCNFIVTLFSAFAISEVHSHFYLLNNLFGSLDMIPYQIPNINFLNLCCADKILRVSMTTPKCSFYELNESEVLLDNFWANSLNKISRSINIGVDCRTSFDLIMESAFKVLMNSGVLSSIFTTTKSISRPDLKSMQRTTEDQKKTEFVSTIAIKEVVVCCLKWLSMGKIDERYCATFIIWYLKMMEGVDFTGNHIISISESLVSSVAKELRIQPDKLDKFNVYLMLSMSNIDRYRSYLPEAGNFECDLLQNILFVRPHCSNLSCNFLLDSQLNTKGLSIDLKRGCKRLITIENLCSALDILSTLIKNLISCSPFHKSFTGHIQKIFMLFQHMLTMESIRPDLFMEKLLCIIRALSDCLLQLLESVVLSSTEPKFSTDVLHSVFSFQGSVRKNIQREFQNIIVAWVEMLSSFFQNFPFETLSIVAVQARYFRSVCSYYVLLTLCVCSEQFIDEIPYDKVIYQSIIHLKDLAVNDQMKSELINLIYIGIVYFLVKIPISNVDSTSKLLEKLANNENLLWILSIHLTCPCIAAELLARSVLNAAVLFLEQKPVLCFYLIVELVRIWWSCVSNKDRSISAIEEILIELEGKLANSTLNELFAESIVEKIYFPLLSINVVFDDKVKLELLHRLDKLFRVENVIFSAKFKHMLICKISLMEEHEMCSAASILRNFNKQYSLAASFAEDITLVLYNILTSDFIYYRSYSSIFDGSLKNCLQTAITIYSEDYSADDILNIICSQSGLLAIAWNLDGNAQNKCGKALKILSSLISLKQWNIFLSEKTWEITVLENVERVLPSKFLHLMSSFVQHDWGCQKIPYKLQALSALSGLISLFAPVDVVKYLPKILIVVDMAISLGCYHSLVNAINVLSILLEQLPADYQQKNISSLIVLLYPFFDSRIFCISCQPSEHQINEIKYLSLGLLKKLLAKNDVSCFGIFLLMPDAPELNKFRQQQLIDMKVLSTQQMWETICKLLRHESSIVKKMALSRCRFLLIERKNDYHRAFFEHSHDNLVLQLIAEFIRLDLTESDSEMLLECAKCIGEVGAWDPSIIPLKILNQFNNASMDSFLPWDLSLLVFGVYLLSTYFIPGLKASQGSMQQDRWGFGIQQLLKELGKECNNTNDNNLESMPIELKQLLNQQDIGEFCEPFWKSKYILSDSISPIKLPFQDSQLSFSRWIGNLSKYLIDSTTGKFSKIFRACRGVVKSSEDLCQFILPYLIFELLMENNSSRLCAVIAEFQNVLSYCRSYDSKEKPIFSVNKYNMKIQCVFTIIDCFSKWISHHLTKKRDIVQDFNTHEQYVTELKKFLSQLPADILSDSAFAIGAYARGLKFLEIYCRENSSHTKSTTVNNDLHSSFDNIPRKQKNEQIRLSHSQICSLANFYVALEDQDGFIGVDVIKRINGYHNSIKDKILKYEQSDDWLPALLAYELIQNSQQYRTAYHGRLLDHSGNSHNSIMFSEVVNIERGKMRCLIELGHLENAIQQSSSKFDTDLLLLKSVLPMGIEASWKLMKWECLSLFIKVAGESHFEWENENDNFSISLGNIFSSLASGEYGTCSSYISKAQIKVMTSLYAASMESMTHSYPGVCKLHILHELETASKLLKFQQPTIRKSYLEYLEWDDRYNRMPDSMKFRNQLLAVRRSILSIAQFPQEVGKIWLQSSEFLRKSGRYDGAQVALENAHLVGVDNELILLEECKLLRAQGFSHKALMLLEPAEIDVNSIGGKISDDKQRTVLAKKIHLGTKLMVESQQCHGKVIVERYGTVVNLDPNSDEAFYDFGKYYEYLYHDSLEKKEQMEVFKQSVSSVKFFEQAMEKYGYCLKIDVVKTNTQVLPRLLTLWLSFTAIADVPSSELQPIKSNKMNNKKAQLNVDSIDTVDLVAVQQKCNNFILQLAQETPARIWFYALQQITSRVLHPNKSTVNVLESLLFKVLVEYPRQTIWHIATLMYSMNIERRSIAKKLLKDSYKQLVNMKQLNNAQMLIDSQRFFQNLINLAGHQCKEKQIKWTMDPKVNLTNFFVPCEDTLLNCENWNGSLPESRCISKFRELVDVATSKAKPKTFTFETIGGRLVRFLCKQEKDGDLRKDSHMMEINNMLNRLFCTNTQSRKRKLGLRTYAVVCLNEECGILEWVNNTECFRQVISQAHSFYSHNDGFPHVTYKEVYHSYIEMQNKYDDDIYGLVAAYKNLIYENYRYVPCLHRWFVESFTNPTEWFEGRTKYIRSAAVWSGVGHMIGLGDRHTENILIDVTNGECVHVDFDCLFDKGLTLLKPEIIPFRLTSNMIDAMGVIGVEGVFRISLETTLMVLRESKEILLSVLEPFLSDPTVAWSRRGRAQKSSTMGSSESTSTKSALNINDNENKESKEMLNKINGRLIGIYNIVHPHREKLMTCADKRGDIPPSRGIGSSRDELLPLSVMGQAQRLIDEATALENLAQLYIGWQPWL